MKEALNNACILKRCYLLVWLSLFSFYPGWAQKYTTESGVISFFSDAPVEDIAATNNAVGSLFDAASGDLVFVVPIKDFQFDKRLMREHFNEKYMETHKFPKASFKGKMTGYESAKAGAQEVTVAGALTIHGVTRDIRVKGAVQFTSGKLNASSKFMVKLATIIFRCRSWCGKTLPKR